MTETKKIWEPEDDWFYESNIQDKIIEFLISEDWEVKAIDTKSRKRGADISGERYGDKLRVEVKGYPSDRYVRGKDKGKTKKTIPAIQARHWFGEALLTLIIAKGKEPELKIAMGLPMKKTYETKWKEIKWLRDKLELKVYWVDEQGFVQTK